MSGRNASLDKQYLRWLYKHVGTVTNRNPNTSHWELLSQLYKTRFAYFVPNDKNRAADGRQLREEFLDQLSTDEWDSHWMMSDCSMLEMLIALCIRADFQTDSDAPVRGVGCWFWEIMDNLNLKQYTDSVYEPRILESVDRALTIVNDRTYKPNGRGGLFPLRRPKEDQRGVELWYQLAAYLLENRYVKL